MRTEFRQIQGPSYRHTFSEHEAFQDHILKQQGVVCSVKVSSKEVSILILPEEKFNHLGAYYLARVAILGMAGAREIVNGKKVL